MSDDKTLNDSMPDDSKRVPFTNMIYVGDGLSDVPCMKMMRAYGGQAIAVYQQENRQGVEDLLAKGRVDFIFLPTIGRAPTWTPPSAISSGKWPLPTPWRRKMPPSAGTSAREGCPTRPVCLRNKIRKARQFYGNCRAFLGEMASFSCTERGYPV